MTLLITEQDVEKLQSAKLLSIKAAIPVIEEVFRMAGEGNAENHPRFHTPFKKGKGLQFESAMLYAKQLLGFKLSANFGSPLKQRWDFLYSMEPSELLAVIQARELSMLRTCATSAVAVRYLSPPTARVVGMYGSARHAETQLEAICAVRPIEEAHVYSPTKENREAFCRKMSQRLGIKVTPMQAPEQVPREADIIVTITRSETPVLLGDWMTRPCLVVGVGANEWQQRELDEKAVEKARLIIVDDMERSKMGTGDLLWPIAHGLLRWDQVKELGDVIVGNVPVPDFASDTILFESGGLAIEDVAIAAMAYKLARAQGLGSEIGI